MVIKTHPLSPTGGVDPLFRSYAEKMVLDYSKLAKIAQGYQALGRKVVATIGSWDSLHIGQVRYLIRARNSGDMLVAAFDTDRAIRLYKGPNRPLIPEGERAEMLTYYPEVSFVTAIDDVDEKGRWQYGLLEAIRPDVFVAVVDSYPEEQLAQIRQYCQEVIVLPRQAETSTSAIITKMLKVHFEEFLDGVNQRKAVEYDPGPPVHSGAP